MKRNIKLTILMFLIVIVVFIWIPKRRRPAAVSADTTCEQTAPVSTTITKKRTEFVDWGRNPFVWPETEQEKEEENNTVEILNLKVYAIYWDDKNSEAMIEESVVRIGDKIAGRTVKQITENEVILTDGTKDYVLKLHEW